MPPGRILTPGRGPNGPQRIDARRPISGGLGVGVWQPPNPATLTTVRYVRKSGADSNGGTSPSDAWLTVTKALQTASPGTVIRVGAGVYRETVQVTITPTPSLPVAVVGDIDGAWTGDAGMVQITAYTTNDKTAPSATTLLDLNGKSNLTFQNIFFVMGTALAVTATTTTSRFISFKNCAWIGYFINGVGVMSVTNIYSVPLNWRIDQCSMIATQANSGALILIDAEGFASGPDYSMDFVITNSFFQIIGQPTTPAIVRFTATALTARAGGFAFRNCLLLGGLATVQGANNISLAMPVQVVGCVILNTSGLSANVSGALIEDYNLLLCGVPRTNVAVGKHSNSDGAYAPLFHFGQERLWGANLRPFGEPMSSSPLNAFGGDGGQLPYDIRGGPRPTGLLIPATGAYERGNNFIKETGTVHTGTNAISVTGDGFADFDLPVDAGTRIISVYCQVDSNYRGPAPRLQILSNGEIGVGDPRDDGSPAGVGASEQLAVQIVPTASGIVTVRVISSDVSGIAKTIFDTFAVA